MAITVNEIIYKSKGIKLFSDIKNDTLINIVLLNSNSDIIEANWIEYEYSIESDVILENNTIYLLYISTVNVLETYIRFLYIDDTIITSPNNVYKQLISLDNTINTEYILNNSNKYTLKFNVDEYDTSTKQHSPSTDKVIVYNNDIILNKLIEQYFIEYKTFFNIINSVNTNENIIIDQQYINNLHSIFMKNIVKFYSLKGNITYIKLMFSLYAKYTNNNIISIVEDPINNFSYRISSSLSKRLWESQIKPYVHPLSWNIKYSEIPTTMPNMYQLIDVRSNIRTSWKLNCISHFDAEEYADSYVSHYKKLKYLYHSSGNIEKYNYYKIAHLIYLDHNTVYTDKITSKKYLLEYNNDFLKLKETDLPDTLPRKIIRDEYNKRVYDIIIENEKIKFIETSKDNDYSNNHFIKDYTTDIIYEIKIFKGIVKIFDNVIYDTTVEVPAITSFYIEPTKWNLISVDNIFKDTITGLVYIALVKNNNISIVPSNSTKFKKVQSTDYNYNIINDTILEQSYILTIANGILIKTVTDYDDTLKTDYYVKNYIDDSVFILNITNDEFTLNETEIYQHIHSECTFNNINDHKKFDKNLNSTNLTLNYFEPVLYKELKDLKNIKFTVDRFNKSVIVDFKLTGVANEYIYEVYNNNYLTNILVSYSSKAILPYNDNDVIILKLKKNDWEQYVYKIEVTNQSFAAFNKAKTLKIADNDTRDMFSVRNDNRYPYQYNDIAFNNFLSETNNHSLSYTNDIEFMFTDSASASEFISEFDSSTLYTINSSILVGDDLVAYKNLDISYAKSGFYTYKWSLYEDGNLVEYKETHINKCNFHIINYNNTNTIGLELSYKNGSYSLTSTIQA